MANMLETSGTTYSPLQRAVSLTVGMAFGLPMTTAAAMANGPAMPVFTPQAAQWGSHSGAATIHAASTNAAGFSHTNFSNMATTLVHTAAASSTAPALIHARQSSVLQNLGNIGVLNLASSKLNFLAGNLANFQSLTIDVAGHTKVVDLNTKLTAAEMVAAEQVLSGAGQTIKIGATGAATGGQVNLNNGLVTALDGALGGSLTSLTVAHGVSVVDNLASLALAGNLFNYGSIFTASGSLGGTDAITANNVINARGGSIGSYAGGSGLFGADLNLTGLTSVLNAGTISSVNNLNVVSPSLTNTGTISSVQGNVNFASPGALNFVGSGGTVQAASGNVNFASGAGGDINVNGGNLLSQQVNYSAAQGNVNAYMDQVSGVVNAAGNNVHVFANSTNLALGTVDAANDPILANTGNIDVSTLGAVAGAPYTIIAGGNITGSTAINTSAAAGGGDVNLIAGANFTPASGGTNVATTVTGASKTGGSITLSSGSSINTSATAANSQGGNVQLIAYAGSAAGSGVVNTGAATINTSAVFGGNVTVIAGAKTGTAIQLGAINANGTGNSGTVNLDASTPVITVTTKGTSGVGFDATGAQTTNAFAAKTLNAADVTVGNITGGILQVSTAGNATATNTTSPLNVGNIVVSKTATLTTTGANAIVSTGITSINAGTLALNSGTGSDVIATNSANLVLNTSGNVTDTQGTATLGVSGNVAGGSTLAVTGAGQVNVNGALFVNNGTLDLSTTTTSKGGIGILAPVLLGTTGNATLNALGKGLISEAKGVTFAAGSTTLNTANNIGTTSAPFTTNNTTALTVNDTGIKAKAYVADTSFGAMTFSGNNGALVAGGSLFLTSSSSALTLGTVNYNTVTITDAAVGSGNKGVIVGFGNVGSGTGVVTINSASGISQTGFTTGALRGTTVTLGATAPGGSIGSAANSVLVSTPILNATSTQSSVYINDDKAVTVTGSASINGFFDVSDNGVADAKTGNSLTTGKAITGGVIVLTTAAPPVGAIGSIAINGAVGTAATQTVSINSANGLTSKGTILGNNINLTSADGPVTVGGKIGDANTSLTLTSASTTGVTITSPLSGHDIAIIATAGPLTTKSTISGQGANSAVTLEGTSTTATGNAVVVGGVITGATINLGYADSKTGQGNIAINSNIGNAATGNVNVSTISGAAGGSIVGKGLITGTNADLGAQNSIGTATAPVQTAVGTLSTQQVSTASGNGAFITQKGNINLGNSTDNNLVVKVTGAIDVTGTVAAPNYALTSTGNTVIDGVLTNTTGVAPTTGTQTITVGGNFTVSQSGTLTNTVGSSAVTATVTGATTIDGKTSVDTLNLNSKGGFNLTSGAFDNDGADNITTTGSVLLAGTIGSTDRPGNFGLTTNGTVTLAPGLSFIAGANITGATIINYTTLDGNGTVALTATGTGNAFINNAQITGINIDITTSSPTGILFNAPGATIIAAQKALQVSAPTVSLNTYNINNQGTITAIGLVSQLQGTLNITSPGALTIQGKDGSFSMNYFSAVNLKAGGNITVGGVVNGVTSNPFSLFNAAHELGNFSVTTPGTFSTPMAGVSVVTNTTGSFGGTIAITASNVLYNGTGATPTFALSATGAGPTLSNGNVPVLLDITGSQGLSVGGTTGRYSVNIEGYGNTSTSTFATPGVLNLDTTSNFNANYTSLALTGSSRVLINGNLNEGTLATTTLTINTNSTAPFMIGGADATKGNGQTGITLGQGISAGVVVINTGGSITLGTGGTTPVGAVLNGTTSVTLATNSLTVNPNSDIGGLSLSVALPVTATSGDLSYTVLTKNGMISASAINLTDTFGNVVLSSGSGTAQTVLAVGTNPNGPAISGVQVAGGTFNINAGGLKYSSGGLLLNATGGIDGGIVNLNISGLPGATTNQTVTVGLGKGDISANVADTVNALDGAGTGQFHLTNAGDIIVNDLNAAAPSLSSINLGAFNGSLSFVANSGVNLTTGSTVLVDGTNLSGLGVNLFQIASSSTSPLLAQGATTNGITTKAGSTLSLFGGDLAFSNFGTVVTNGAVLEGVSLNFVSSTGIDVSKNTAFHVGFEETPTGTSGGSINFSAPFVTVATSGLQLSADGGELKGGSITVTTTVMPIVVGLTQAVGGASGIASAISFDVGNMQQGLTNPNFVAGTVTINSPGAIKIDGRGVSFWDPSFTVFDPGFGGSLNLNAGPSSPITLTNASGLIGLNYNTINFNETATTPFLLAGASASGGNGIVGTAADLTNNGVLTAGIVVVNNPTGSVVTTNEQMIVHTLTLNAAGVTFAKGQTIDLTFDGPTVGVGGPIVTPSTPSGNGGVLTITTPSITFAGTGTTGVTINAPGAGGDSEAPSSIGGIVTINYSGASTLNINNSTFASINLSNAIGDTTMGQDNKQTAGTFSVNSTLANVVVVGSSSFAPNASGTNFVYGDTGGTFQVAAPNVAFTNIASLSEPSQDNTGVGLGLTLISFTTNSATPFSVGNASGKVVNGITDANPLLIATGLTVVNSFAPAANATTGGIDMSDAQGVTVSNLTLTTPSVLTFAAGGTYTIVQQVATNTLPLNAGLGGTLTISAGSLAYTGTSNNPTTFIATGSSATGAAGTVAITVTGTNPINIGTGAGDLAFDLHSTGATPGALAGNLTIVNAGNINADFQGLTYGPAEIVGSGTLSLTAPNILVTNANAINGYGLGAVNLTTTSASDFKFGSALVNGFADTAATTIIAGGINISNNATGLLTSGIDTTGNVTVSANVITLTTLNTITLQGGGGLTAYPLTAVGSTGAGGTIALTASNYVISGAGPVTLSAIAANVGGTGGPGGTISVTDTGKNATLNLNSADGLVFKVQGGSDVGGEAGNVVVNNAGGNINVNGDAFTFGPQLPNSNAGTGTLALSAINVLFSNAAALSAQPVNKITVATTSNNDFVFGGAKLNGFTDIGDSLTAGSLIVSNNTGGALYGGIDATGLTNGNFAPSVTNLTLNTLNTITFNLSATPIAMVAVVPSGAGGSITIDAGAINFTGAGPSVMLNAIATGTGTGGTVTIADVSTAGLKVGTGGFAINVSNAGGGMGGTVSVISGGALTVDGSVITFGTNFPVLGGPSLTLNADGILAFSNAKNVDLGNQVNFILSSDSAQAFLLGGATAGTNGITDSGLSLYGDTFQVANQGGAIELGTAAGVSSGTSMNLNAATDIGAIAPIVLNGTTQNLNVQLTAGGVVNLHVTDTAGTAIGVSTIIGRLVVDTNATAGSLAVGYVNLAPALVTARSIDITYNNPGDSDSLTIGSLNAFDGDLNAITRSGNFIVPLQTVITAYNGNILFQNLNADKGSNITFTSGFTTFSDGVATVTPGATVKATGPTPLTDEGNVTIVMGATGFTPVKGTDPNNAIVLRSGENGAVDFGVQGTNPNGTITVLQDTSTGVGSSLEGLDRSLIFSTGALGDQAITVGAHVTITADPPGSIIYAPTTDRLAGSGGAAAAAVITLANQSNANTNNNSSSPVGNSGSSANIPAFSTLSATGNTMSLTSSSVTQAAVVSTGLGGANAITTGGLVNAGMANSAVINAGGNATINAVNVSNANSATATALGNSITNADADVKSSAKLNAKDGAVTNVDEKDGRTLTGGISNNARRSLQSGTLLLSPLQDTVVDTPAGPVNVACGSMALIISSNKGVAVYNMHDGHKGAVAITVGSEVVSVSPGRSVVVSNSTHGFEEVNPAPFVTYRRLSDRMISSGIGSAKVFHADFDIISVIRGLAAVKDMMKAEDKQTRSAMTNMLKTAAILSQFGRSNEPYAVYLTPELTAYANSAQH